MSHLNEPLVALLPVRRGVKGEVRVMPLGTIKADTPAQDDAAERWASAFVSKLRDITNLAGLDAFLASKAKKLGELETARSDLHARCMDAAASARNALSEAPAGSDGDDF